MELTTSRFERLPPPTARCGHGYGCEERPTWIHRFPNGGTVYLCEEGKWLAEQHYAVPHGEPRT